MTATLPTIGSTIQVQVSGSTSSPFGFVQYDYEIGVLITVTAEMHDSWQKWGSEYRTFEDMVASVHHDEVDDAMRGME